MRRQNFTFLDVSAGITVSFGAVGSPRVNIWYTLIHERVIGPFFFDEDIIPRHVRKLPSSTAQQQQSYSLTGRWTCSFCSHCPWLCEHVFPRLMERKRRTVWPPCSPALSPLGFFLWGCVKDQLCSQRVNLEHRSLQQPHMLWRTCYSVSGKGWTTGGMYARLQMELKVKCFISNNFPTCGKQNCLNWWIKYCKQYHNICFCSCTTGARNPSILFSRSCMNLMLSTVHQTIL